LRLQGVDSPFHHARMASGRQLLPHESDEPPTRIRVGEKGQPLAGVFCRVVSLPCCLGRVARPQPKSSQTGSFGKAMAIRAVEQIASWNRLLDCPPNLLPFFERNGKVTV
jgi:hypothetical protein